MCAKRRADRGDRSPSRPAREVTALMGDGGVGGDVGGDAVELLRVAVGMLNRHVALVRGLERPGAADRDDAAAARFDAVLDGLLNMAHLGHRFLRHADPRVRHYAERLTDSTATMIGDMYTRFGVRCLSWGRPPIDRTE